MFRTQIALCFVLLIAVSVIMVAARPNPSEKERATLWRKKGNQWPPSWQPERSGLKETMRRREEELMMIPGADERWENWMQFTQARLVPRFTTTGFKVVQTPSIVYEKLRTTLDRGLTQFDRLPNDTRNSDSSYNPLSQKIIYLNGLEREIMDELKSVHENWSGLSLQPTSVHGIRLNRNGSSVVMHYEKVATHVISCLIHINSEYESSAQPWPMEIEDHDGTMHSLVLQPGEMLLYESASALHGRRELFRGRYSASLSIHYRPAEKSVWNYTTDSVVASVPPHWHQNIIENHGNRLIPNSMTIESLTTKGMPPRIIQGKTVDDLKLFYEGHRKMINSLEL
jgi:hypothetical protein